MAFRLGMIVFRKTVCLSSTNGTKYTYLGTLLRLVTEPDDVWRCGLTSSRDTRARSHCASLQRRLLEGCEALPEAAALPRS